jgi:hypothetical protein
VKSEAAAWYWGLEGEAGEELDGHLSPHTSVPNNPTEGQCSGFGPLLGRACGKGKAVDGGSDTGAGANQPSLIAPCLNGTSN